MEERHHLDHPTTFIPLTLFLALGQDLHWLTLQMETEQKVD
jgi:hypothetical protein